MQVKISRSLVGLLCLLAVGVSSRAAVLYDTGAPTFPFGNETTVFVLATPFELPAGGSIAGGGAYITSFAEGLSTWDGTFEYFLFLNAGDRPGTLTASGTGQNVSATYLSTWTVFTSYLYLFEWNLENPFAAEPGTTYWLGLHLASGFDSNGGLGWNQVSGGSSAWGLSTLDTWFVLGGQRAFYLSDEPVGSDVPEPTTINLLGASLLGLMWVRRKRSKSLATTLQRRVLENDRAYWF